MHPKNPDPCQSFNAEIQALLNSNNPDAYSIIPYIQRCLRQFNLNGRYQPSDILHETYLRGVRAIESGETIKNFLAWTRGTAYNIIREFSRDAKRSQAVDPNSGLFEAVLQAASGNLVAESEIEEDLRVFLISLEAQNPADFKILRLKYMEGLSWREISQRLVASGEEVQSEETLRQKASRAKKKLRQTFDSIKQPTSAIG